jgi:mannose-6-phosphate isomerase-like protein (cupin superfamily)
MTDPAWKSSRTAIMAILGQGPDAPTFHYPITLGRMRVGLYAPRGTDSQSPHAQDEVYIVASGKGWFCKGQERIPVEAEDVLLVEAGIPHRFEDFSDDFATWVFFAGPDKPVSS